MVYILSSNGWVKVFRKVQFINVLVFVGHIWSLLDVHSFVCSFFLSSLSLSFFLFQPLKMKKPFLAYRVIQKARHGLNLNP